MMIPNSAPTTQLPPNGRLLSLGPTPPPSKLSAAIAHERLLIIEPGRTEKAYWSDLWVYRELFAILAWRDLAVRYKHTVIGAGWAVIRPTLTMIIFTVIFGRVAKLPSDGIAPYPIMVFVGMLPWTLFSTILNDASNSMVGNAHLIGKVYFPRLILPAATMGVALVDFAITFVLMLLMMAWLRFWPDWRVFLLPLFVGLGVLAAIGPGLVMTAMNVRYRDFRYLLPFVLQFGVYISPVGFSSQVVPEKWRLLYSLNPAVGVIDGFRWSLLGGESPLYLPGFLVSLSVVTLFLCLGVWYFRKTERTFADLL